jgi:hypothetical protein
MIKHNAGEKVLDYTVEKGDNRLDCKLMSHRINLLQKL